MRALFPGQDFQIYRRRSTGASAGTVECDGIGSLPHPRNPES
jgi:hypothetical protein